MPFFVQRCMECVCFSNRGHSPLSLLSPVTLVHKSAKLFPASFCFIITLPFFFYFFISQLHIYLLGTRCPRCRSAQNIIRSLFLSPSAFLPSFTDSFSRISPHPGPNLTDKLGTRLVFVMLSYSSVAADVVFFFIYI